MKNTMCFCMLKSVVKPTAAKILGGSPWGAPLPRYKPSWQHRVFKLFPLPTPEIFLAANFFLGWGPMSTYKIEAIWNHWYRRQFSHPRNGCCHVLSFWLHFGFCCYNFVQNSLGSNTECSTSWKYYEISRTLPVWLGVGVVWVWWVVVWCLLCVSLCSRF